MKLGGSKHKPHLGLFSTGNGELWKVSENRNDTSELFVQISLAVLWRTESRGVKLKARTC